MSKRRILIVGGGIAGLALGPLLETTGLEVSIAECRRSPADCLSDARLSVNLALSQRGLRVLERLGLREAISRVSVPMRGRAVHHGGEATQLPYDLVGDLPIYSVQRADLVELLHEHARRRVDVRFDARCVAVDAIARAAALSEGTALPTWERFEGLIGADGAHSAVRRSLFQGDPAAVPTQHRHGYKQLSIAPAAARRAGLDPGALHIWPRSKFMLIALPNRDGSFTATLFLPREGELSFKALQTEADVETFITAHFGEIWPLIEDTAPEILSKPQGHIVSVRATPWNRGATLLIGDAAHAMPPFLGQGMNCALEDCLVLEASVRKHDDLETAFAAFHHTRRPDVEAVMRLSHENYDEMKHTVMTDAFLRARNLEAELQGRFPNRYMPLYAMIAFTAIPYRVALERAAKQHVLRSVFAKDEARFRASGAALERLVESSLSPLPI